ncbi:GNAT family N-acetyltransferase [Rhodophyticola sp.]|jgi:GNAT superfamily N-acetyltransferase|uniref:GNAT family N-acetyltransferase n=1 Tax=Rhodophyticola sp. TaxID=2680032 RepID=UPI003D2A0AB0
MTAPGLLVRRAKVEDAPAASEVLRASITRLCGADHGDDPEVIAGWVANKTPDWVRRMIGDETGMMLVAERGRRIVGVGMIGELDPAAGKGAVLLNYVAPTDRGTGVSTAALAHMELQLQGQGVRRAHLVSTRTARRFYEKAGWQPVISDRQGGPVEGVPMEKWLTPAGSAR